MACSERYLAGWFRCRCRSGRSADHLQFSASYTENRETALLRRTSQRVSPYSRALMPVGLTKAQDRRYALFLDATRVPSFMTQIPIRFGLQGQTRTAS
jgi:hypothetical protein